MTADPWSYETAADLDRTLSERLKDFPREPDMLVYGTRLLAGAVLRAWLRAYHRLAIRGREQIPVGKSCVLVANHASHLDTFCLLAALPINRLHRTFPAAAKDYFFESMPRAALASIVVNALPFNRETSIRQSLALCQRLLETAGQCADTFSGRNCARPAENWGSSSRALVCCWREAIFRSFPAICAVRTQPCPKEKSCRDRARSN